MSKSIKKAKFTPVRVCEHCNNKAPMLEIAGHSDVTSHSDPSGRHTWEEGYIYSIDQCPACKGLVMSRYYWHDAAEPEEMSTEVIYPVASQLPDGLPPSISKALDAARRVRAIDANAYVVLIGRVLEMVCQDRTAVGRSLAEKLADLAAKGEIPAKLATVAAGLRQLRNVGAHPELGELTASDVPLLDDLSGAILEYVYSAPLLVQRAEQRLSQLKRASKPTRTVKPKRRDLSAAHSKTAP